MCRVKGIVQIVTTNGRADLVRLWFSKIDHTSVPRLNEEDQAEGEMNRFKDTWLSIQAHTNLGHSSHSHMKFSCSSLPTGSVFLSPSLPALTTPASCSSFPLRFNFASLFS